MTTLIYDHLNNINSRLDRDPNILKSTHLNSEIFFYYLPTSKLHLITLLFKNQAQSFQTFLNQIDLLYSTVVQKSNLVRLILFFNREFFEYWLLKLNN